MPIHPKHLYDSNRNKFLRESINKGIIFLDVGSGVGTECLYAAKNGANMVYGIEKNAILVEHSIQKLNALSVNFEIFKLDLEQANIPLDDKSVDLINFSNVLEHLNNRIAILQELSRLLHPNGCLVVSIPNRSSPWKVLQRKAGIDSRDDPDHKIEYDIETLYDEFNVSGLEICSPLNPIVPSLPINGMIALTAAFSPKLYKNLQNWKVRYAAKNPKHSVGWVLLATVKKPNI